MIETVSNIFRLDEKGDFFSHFFVHNPAPMWIFQVTTLSFLEVNPAAINSYGYSREEFLGMTIKDIRPQEDIILLENRLAEIDVTASKASSNKRYRHFKKDGTCIWVTISSFEVLFRGVLVRVVTANDVTKYHEQELALCLVNKELGEYKKAITTSSIVSITNRRGIIEYANENFATLTGYSRSELIGSSHNIINSGYHPQSFWNNMWHTIMTGATCRGEVCNKKKNGDYYWVDSFIIPVKNNGGRIERIFSIRIDITERKNKETEVSNLNNQLVAINRELTESKKELEKLSLVAKLTASEVLILNKNRQIIWVNDAFTRLTGYTLAEAVGKKPSELLHGPNSCQQTTLEIKDAIDNKRPFKTEVIHYSKTGEECCLLTDGQPVLDENGDLLQYVIVETDITELKQKQAAVRHSEIKLNAFFNTTANLHLLVDRDLNILAFNKVAEDFMQNFMHSSVALGDYLPPKLEDPIKDNFIHFTNQALEGNATINRQAEIQTKTGVLFWMVNYMPAYDRDGEVIGAAFTAVDITASKKAEAEINRQNGVFKEIAWKQSHIVRAPLANILSLATLLEKKVDEDLRFALKHEAEKLDFIIRDIVNKTIEAKAEA